MDQQVISPEIAVSQQTQGFPEKRAQSVVREANGKFVSGHGKPGPGRPKTALISQALRDKLERGGAAKYAAAVEKIALKGKREADRLAAVNLIADRTEGKPVQAMLVGHTIDESSVRLIAEILGKLHNPAQIEGESE